MPGGNKLLLIGPPKKRSLLSEARTSQTLASFAPKTRDDSERTERTIKAMRESTTRRKTLRLTTLNYKPSKKRKKRMAGERQNGNKIKEG